MIGQSTPNTNKNAKWLGDRKKSNFHCYLFEVYSLGGHWPGGICFDTNLDKGCTYYIYGSSTCHLCYNSVIRKQPWLIQSSFNSICFMSCLSIFQQINYILAKNLFSQGKFCPSTFSAPKMTQRWTFRPKERSYCSWHIETFLGL